jgi:dCTP deaminase
MILTGSKIRQAVLANDITISPFSDDNVNPNSYNFTLGDTLLVYKPGILDPKKVNQTFEITIPEEGFIIEPDKVYLGHTLEVMGSNKYVPIIRGRSSTGRLGLFVHITADLIDIGSINQYTLMLHSVQPVKIYPGMKIGQVTFWEVSGDITLYRGKYQGKMGPQASQIHKDFTSEL